MSDGEGTCSLTDLDLSYSLANIFYITLNVHNIPFESFGQCADDTCQLPGRLNDSKFYIQICIYSRSVQDTYIWSFCRARLKRAFCLSIVPRISLISFS